MSRSLLAAALVLAGCAASRVAPGLAGGLSALWAAPGPAAPPADACADAFGTSFSDFGARGLACESNRVTPLGTAAAASGLAVFASGPHAPGPDGPGLDLSARTFGHYNPAFVRWAVENGIPGEGNAVARAATQGVYAARVQRLARVYWLVHTGLVADGYPARVPVGPEKDYVRYLRGGPLGAGANNVYPGFTVTAFGDRSWSVPAALGIAEEDLAWYEVQYEANTATGFWLRRAEDGTHDAFRDGLRRLLAAYDAAWLAERAV